MQCPKCGSLLPDSAPYCPHCGATLAGGRAYEAADDAPTSLISPAAAGGDEDEMPTSLLRPGGQPASQSGYAADDAPTSMLGARQPNTGYTSPSQTSIQPEYDGDMPTCVQEQPGMSGGYSQEGPTTMLSSNARSQAGSFDEVPTSLISQTNGRTWSQSQPTPGGYGTSPVNGMNPQPGPMGGQPFSSPNPTAHTTNSSLSTHSYRGSPSGMKTYTAGIQPAADLSSSRPKKKASAAKWILIAVLVLVAGLGVWGGLGYLFPNTVWLPEPIADMLGVSGADGDISISETDLTLVALQDQEAVTKPFSSKGNGSTYSKDDEVHIIARARKPGDKTVYGQTEDKDWLIISKDGGNHYLRDKTDMLRAPSIDPDSLPSGKTPSGNGSAASEKPVTNTAPDVQTNTPAAAPSRSLSDSFTLGIGSTIRKQDNWSGPACGVIVLDFFGLSSNQETIAQKTVTSNGVCDYTQLARYLSDRLRPYGYNYTGKYYELNEKPNMNALFASLIDVLENDDAPVLVVVKDAAFTGDSRSCYAIVYGLRTYSDGSHDFYLFCPSGSGEQEVVSEDELAAQMQAAGFVCALY